MLPTCLVEAIVYSNKFVAMTNGLKFSFSQICTTTLGNPRSSYPS